MGDNADQAARMRALEAVLSELLDDSDIGFEQDDSGCWCVYCQGEPDRKTLLLRHTPDCPVSRGRALLDPVKQTT